MKQRALVLASFISVLMVSCADADGVKVDLCPDDPNKLVPGVCGCGEPDEDKDDNGIIDCLETGVLDLCPDDPNKLVPGVCGCGKSDEDNDGDGVPDCLNGTPIPPGEIDLCPNNPARLHPGVCGCDALPSAEEDTDGDGVPDCLDRCETNRDKVDPGVCGCEVADDEQTLGDDDGDGVPNCLDACPDNPTKSTPGVGCDVDDSDGDGIDDGKDACPYNAHIAISIDEAPADLDCQTDKDDSTHIRKAGDLEQLVTGLDSSCVYTDYVPVCLPSGNVTICSNSVVKASQCSDECVTDEKGRGSCTTTGIIDTPPHRYLILDSDIDLAEYIETSEDESGHCFPKDWKSFPALSNTTFESPTGAVIRYTYNGRRCTLPDELFNNITSSHVSGITLDVDFEGDVHGSWSQSASGSTFTNVTFSGTVRSTATSDVGGFLGSVSNSELNGIRLDHASVIAPQANAVGGIAGSAFTTSIVGRYMGLRSTSKTPDLHSELIYGKSKVGGVIGSSTHIELTNLANDVERFICTSGNCGGFVGYINNSNNNEQLRIITVKNTIDQYESNGEYTGGFAGWLKGKGTSTISNIISEIRSDIVGTNYVGGFVGQMDEYVHISNVTSTFQGQIQGAEAVGGFAGRIRDDNSLNLVNSTVIGGITGSGKSVGGFIGHLQTSGNNVSYITNTIRGPIIGELDNVGGFVGLVKNHQGFSYIRNDVSGGTIRGRNYVGGFAGELESKGIAIDHIDQRITSSIVATKAAGGFIGDLYMTNTPQPVSVEDASILSARVTANTYAGGIAGDLRVKYDASNSPEQQFAVNNALVWAEVVVKPGVSAGDLIGGFDISGSPATGWELLHLENFATYSETKEITSEAGKEVETVRKPRELFYGVSKADWLEAGVSEAYYYVRDPAEEVRSFYNIELKDFTSADAKDALADFSQGTGWSLGDLELAGETLQSVPVLKTW